nr:hypothetical protein GCM10020093_023180 [Planobispora longispora]
MADTRLRGTRAEVRRPVIEPVLRRRRCLLQAPGTDTTTRDIARVVLATLLHKYGMRADDVTAAALAAVDDLDDAAPPTVRQLAAAPPHRPGLLHRVRVRRETAALRAENLSSP